MKNNTRNKVYQVSVKWSLSKAGYPALRNCSRQSHRQTPS